MFHPYADAPESGISVNCYAYTEVFAEKFRALAERTRPRDLYDVINLFRHLDGRPSSSVLRDVLKQKCDYKSIPVPTMEALAPFKEDLEAKWQTMLTHQLPVLPPVADFWAALPEIFNWMTTGAAPPQREIIRAGASEISTIRSRILPMSIPSRARQALEIIRFAATNQLCVDLSYDGKVRRIEPYSLRETADHNYVLHTVRNDSGEHRSYRLDWIQGASVSSQSFSPRYAIELTERVQCQLFNLRLRRAYSDLVVHVKSRLYQAMGRRMCFVAVHAIKHSNANQWTARCDNIKTHWGILAM